MTNSNAHLTLDERRIILKGIENGLTKVAIAEILGKDKSTIGKEIKLHRTCKFKCKLPLECAAYKKCKYGRECTSSCPNYAPFKCKRRDRSPGACNGCPNYSHCRFDKFYYNPEKAHNEYKETLVDARRGVNLTTSEAKLIGDTVKPLLEHGLSPYAILKSHPELNICEKTLYNYIEGGILREVSNVTVMDLRRQVKRRLPKKITACYKKRKDNKYLKGRTYNEYQEYIAKNSNCFVVQMDTVYNNVSEGPFIQTFKFTFCGLMIALYHDTKTAEEMAKGVDLLEEILGKSLFTKYVNVILTDRGTEFSAAERMETSSDGTRRTRVFYCDPMQSGQKGSLENNHIALRYILPKETNLKSLGLTNQTVLNIAVSHINSMPLEKLGGKSPLETADFMWHDLYMRLMAFGIRQIEKDKIILKPYLLKK